MNKPNQFEQELQQQINALPKEQQPTRDLWPGIELALSEPVSQQRQPQYKIWYATAASVLVGILSVALLWQPQQKQVNSDELIQLLSQQHQQQKSLLLAQFADQPAVTDNWQEQLNSLDQAASAIKRALEEEPNNMALLRMLQQVHQKQIDLIEQVHAPQWQQI